MFKSTFFALSALASIIAIQSGFDVNAIPSSLEKRPAIAPEIITKTIVIDSRDRQVKCLAWSIMGEAIGESKKGKRLVAETVLNRVDSWRYPDTVCEVVMQNKKNKKGITVYQFSALDPKDPNYMKIAEAFSGLKPEYTKHVEEAYMIAAKAMTAKERTLAKNVLNYHSTAVNPWWASSMCTYKKEGAHIFYRLCNKEKSKV